MFNSVPDRIENILRAYAASRGVEFNIRFCEHERRDVGYISEIHYMTVRGIKLVVKTADSSQETREKHRVNELYENERYFYETLWPLLDDFQVRVLGTSAHDLLPSCLVSDMTNGEERIVLEDLKAKQFENFDKRGVFSKVQLERIMEHYGKFHAISMAFRKKKPKVFEKKTAKCYDYFAAIPVNLHVINLIKLVLEKILTFAREAKKTRITRKMEGHLRNREELLADNVKYRGTNKVLNHGDCWSNNVMVRYSGEGESKTIEELKLIDFHLVRVGSPVHDLSLCIYSGGTAEIYKDLDHYLKVYHTQLSETLRTFELNPDELYPFQTLKDEWKEYCMFGFIMGLVTMRTKLVSKVNINEVLQDMQDIVTRVDEPEFKKRGLELVKHMHKNDFL